MEKEVTKYLREWVVRFLKNRDLIFKQIQSLEEKDDEILVKFKEKEHLYVVQPFLDKLDFKKFETNHQHKSLVAYNTKKNVDFLVKNWEKFVELGRNFSIFFINPFSKMEKRWILYPHTHNSISEGQNIELGLKSLSERVEITTEEDLNKIIGSTTGQEG